MDAPAAPARPLACCVEGPEPYLPKARYAVETLLHGLGLAPSWTDRAGLTDGGLYYGPHPDEAPEAALRLRLAPCTADAFASPRPFDPARMGTLAWDGASWPLPFGDEGGSAEVLGADVVASAFFWLSGWEEAATRARDRHGRYAYAGSLLERVAPTLPPLVDVYRAWLGERLRERGVAVPGRTWGGRRWAVALTVDVDLVRTRRLGRVARGLRAGSGAAVRQALAPGDTRWQTLLDLAALAEARGVRATWFVKAGAHAPEDVPYRLEGRRLRRFLGALRERGHEVGLHPSYAAYDHPRRLAAERDRLARVLGAPPECVRTHFLRWAEPTTPRLLEKTGFRLDGTLGFAARPGFRRAVATPFRLFDLAADRPLGLRELPLAVMDTTLFEHLALAPEEAERAATAVCDAARRVGGCAVLLWHNGATDPHEAARRLAVLGRVLDRARVSGALVAGLGGARDAWDAAPP